MAGSRRDSVRPCPAVRPARNSVRAVAAILSRPTPLAAIDRRQQRFSFFPSIALLQMTIERAEAQPPAAAKLAPPAYRCSQILPLVAELRLVSVAWVLPTYFRRSSSDLNPDRSPPKGGLVRRLPVVHVSMRCAARHPG